MLVLARKRGQSILIETGETTVEVKVRRLGQERVSLSIHAPGLGITRSELGAPRQPRGTGDGWFIANGRRPGMGVRIGLDISVDIQSIRWRGRDRQVRLAIVAPESVHIIRKELVAA